VAPVFSGLLEARVEPETGSWIVQADGADERCGSVDGVLECLANLEARTSGQAAVTIDLGPVTGWKRFLGIKNQSSPCFAVEWDGAYASLIFHDDAWSEYRAIDEAQPVQPTEAQRKRIAHGEPEPHPVAECMDKTRAFRAMREYLGDRQRPAWLKYCYVP